MTEESPRADGEGSDSQKHPEVGSKNGEQTFSVDETFEILKNNRRRLVLEYLLTHDGEVRLDDLADHVTAIENDTDIDSITSTERKRVYVGLYQFHLPKMADMGVIEYDQDRGNLELTDQGRRLYQEHEKQTAPARKWHLAYLALSLGGVLAVIACLAVWNTSLAVACLAGQTVLLGVLALADAYASGNETLGALLSG